MTKKLHIAPTLSLPIEALTKSFMVVGQRGSGKTNLGVVFCEEFSKQGLPFVVSDPLGVWSGLRSSRDGKKAGIPVFILGGEHGDAPLEPTAGGIVADAIVGSSSSFVLDLSLMRKGQRIHFMADFCERVFEAKATNRAPLHLMFDEADEVAPQNLRHEAGGMAPRLLGAVEDLVRRGRSRGIGFTGITQRPASLNKNVLSQADVMTVFRLAAPQDRAALDEWVKANATKEQIDVFTRELPQLETGHCFVWSPAWLKLFKHVHVRHRETYDSSATPEVGGSVTGPKVMAKVDIAALKERIEATVEVKKAEDPRLLRAKIAALEAQIASREAPVPPQIVERPVVTSAEANAMRSVLVDLGEVLDEFRFNVDRVMKGLDEATGASHGAVAPRTPGFTPPTAPAEPSVRVTKRAAATAADATLTGPQLKILQVLAARHPNPTTFAQLSILTGYPTTSSTIPNNLGALRSRELVGKGQPIRITEAGLDEAGEVPPLPTGKALLDFWLGQLDGPAGKIISEIWDAYPRELTKEQLSKATSYPLTSSTIPNNLGRLRSLELVQKGSLRLGEPLVEAHPRSR